MQANELTEDPAQTSDMTTRGGADDEPSAKNASAAIRVEYRTLDTDSGDADSALPGGLLAAVCFGQDAAGLSESASTMCINVGLEPLMRPAPAELWWAQGKVEQGRSAMVRYAHDDHHLFAVIDIDEREHGGIFAASEAVYAEMQRFQQQSSFPHLLRMWNYFDAINQGAGDLERYRQFCVGRARGLGETQIENYPAATAIGHQHLTHRLQVYWLASRTPGVPIENPRQVSAYRYPRVHGPTSPTFARATLAADGTLLVSGTASIVGHVSQHDGDPAAQLAETLRNLSTLNVGANDAPATETQASLLLKVYVRNAAHLDAVAQRLQRSFPRSSAVFLAADVCRSELLLEIECVQLAAG